MGPIGIVLDYTARIAPATLKAAGAIGVCRYLAPPLQRTAWKRIGSAEYAELRAADIEVTLNWEFDARDWLGGSTAGASHGAMAAAQARALGHPAGGVIVGSADFDMTRAEWISAGRAYARAFATAVRAAGFRPGAYGPWDVLAWVAGEGIMDAFWQAGMSRGWSGGRNAQAWPGAHLRQRGELTVGGVVCDWNDILIPRWGALSAPAPQRQAGEPDMTYLAIITLDGPDFHTSGATGTPQRGWFATDGITCRWVQQAEAEEMIRRHGQPVEVQHAGAVGVLIGPRPAGWPGVTADTFDATDLAAVTGAAQTGAGAGITAVIDGLTAKVVAAVQHAEGDFTPDQVSQVEQAVRDAFAGGLAPRVAAALTKQ